MPRMMSRTWGQYVSAVAEIRAHLRLRQRADVDIVLLAIVGEDHVLERELDLQSGTRLIMAAVARRFTLIQSSSLSDGQMWCGSVIVVLSGLRMTCSRTIIHF